MLTQCFRAVSPADGVADASAITPIFLVFGLIGFMVVKTVQRVQLVFDAAFGVTFERFQLGTDVGTGLMI
jgi:hypothetical protein